MAALGAGDGAAMVTRLEALFPGLERSGFKLTSPENRQYNCGAWAAGETSAWWWPEADPDNAAVYWPAGAASEETLASLATDI